MESPKLPSITLKKHNSRRSTSDSLERTRSLRSSLKKVLSTTTKTAEEEQLFGTDKNQFLIENDTYKHIVVKYILPNKDLGESLLNSDIERQIGFSHVEIHEVENWKEYNKPRKWCCFIS